MPNGTWDSRHHPRVAVTSRLRLCERDYGGAHTYLVTVRTTRRSCLFGDVREGEVYLTRPVS
jgi:hypothetical protein